MEKTISIRPSETIMHLFYEAKNLCPHPENDRNSIFNRALEQASTLNIDWDSISKIKFVSSSVSEINSIPKFLKVDVDEANYIKVVQNIKQSLSVKKVSGPYLIKLVMIFYLKELKSTSKSEIIETARSSVNLGLDCLVFKKEYDYSSHYLKEDLFLLCKQYLIECDKELNQKIRNQINDKIKKFSDYFSLGHAFNKRRSDFGTINITFVAKVLAGLFLAIVEIDGLDLNEIITALKEELKLNAVTA